MPQASDPPGPGLDSSAAPVSAAPGATGVEGPEPGESIARRKLLKQAGWVVPAIVTTVTVSARAAQATCTPRCSPASPVACKPITCNPASCNPNTGVCGPSSCRPRT